MNRAKNRLFTQFAASAVFGHKGAEALNAGKCPCCGGPCDHFRDALSKKEYQISGMCQECQDKVFA